MIDYDARPITPQVVRGRPTAPTWWRGDRIRRTRHRRDHIAGRPGPSSTGCESIQPGGPELVQLRSGSPARARHHRLCEHAEHRGQEKGQIKSNRIGSSALWRGRTRLHSPSTSSGVVRDPPGPPGSAQGRASPVSCVDLGLLVPGDRTGNVSPIPREVTKLSRPLTLPLSELRRGVGPPTSSRQRYEPTSFVACPRSA